MALPAYIERIKTNKSLGQLRDEVAANGWLVNNLFQIKRGEWRANLRFESQDRKLLFHEFADGLTAEEALAAAIFNMGQARYDAAKGFAVSTTKAAFLRNEMARAELTSALMGLTASDALAIFGVSLP